MEIRMIIAGVDLSPCSLVAAAHAAALARPLGAALVLVHALEERAPEIAEQQLDAHRARLRRCGVDVSTRMLRGAPDEVICRVARELDAELIVTGTHGQTGLAHLLVGSVAQRVVRTAPCSVLVARPEPPPPYRNVLVPVDFSAASERALALATIVAAPDARIVALHVGGEPIEREVETSARREAVQDAGLSLINHHRRPSGQTWFEVMAGDPHTRIVVQARQASCDLVVLGSHGRRGLRRVLLGSVAEAVVRDAPCSVLVERGT